MKIAYVFGSLNPSGGEIQTANIVVRLAAAGHDLTVILPHGPGEMEGNLEPFLAARNIPMISTVAKRDKVSAIMDVFRRLNPDAVCSNGYPMTLVGTLAAQQTNVPIRIQAHVDAGLARQQFPQDIRFETAANEATTLFVGNSDAVLRSLRDHPGVNARKRCLIPNGLEIPMVTSEMRAASRKHWKVSDKTVLIGYLANIRADGIKNQMMLVRAAKRVLAEQKNMLFVMVGYHSEYASEVQAEIDMLGLSDAIKLPGRIDNLDLIAGWDIAVNCSHTEGLSNAVQECMAYGLPVVATAVDGNADLISAGETGLLVEDDNDGEMAAALMALIKNPDIRSNLGQAARLDVEHKYGWPTIIGKWLNLYYMQSGRNA